MHAAHCRLTPAAAVVVSTPSWPLWCLQLLAVQLAPRATIGPIRVRGGTFSLRRGAGTPPRRESRFRPCGDLNADSLDAVLFVPKRHRSARSPTAALPANGTAGRSGWGLGLPLRRHARVLSSSLKTCRRDLYRDVSRGPEPVARTFCSCRRPGKSEGLGARSERGPVMSASRGGRRARFLLADGVGVGVDDSAAVIGAVGGRGAYLVSAGGGEKIAASAGDD